MQDGCEVYMEFLHDIQWIMLHGHLDYFQKPHVGERPNTKPGDHDTPDAHESQLMVYSILSRVRTQMK